MGILIAPSSVSVLFLPLPPSLGEVIERKDVAMTSSLEILVVKRDSMENQMQSR